MHHGAELPPQISGEGGNTLIDWEKFNTPEAREAARRSREAFAAKLEAKQASQKRMAEHLKTQVDEGEITNDWEISFIRSICYRVNQPWFSLTDKQDSILTRLFETY